MHKIGNWLGTLAVISGNCLCSTLAAETSNPQLVLSATIDPLYSTNASSTTHAQDDSLVRALLTATLKGNAQDLFGYEFFAGTRNDRFEDLNQANADYALAGFNFDKAVGGFLFRVVGTHVSVYDDYFKDRLVSLFDYGAAVAHPIPLFSGPEGQWKLVPALKVIRRIADVETSERLEVAASLGFQGPLWTGTFAIAAAYGFRPYDVGGQDHNVVVVANWTKIVNKYLAYSLVAKYENNSSSEALRSFESFEIGPSLKISFSTE